MALGHFLDIMGLQDCILNAKFQACPRYMCLWSLSVNDFCWKPLMVPRCCGDVLICLLHVDSFAIAAGQGFIHVCACAPRLSISCDPYAMRCPRNQQSSSLLLQANRKQHLCACSQMLRLPTTSGQVTFSTCPTNYAMLDAVQRWVPSQFAVCLHCTVHAATLFTRVNRLGLSEGAILCRRQKHCQAHCDNSSDLSGPVRHGKGCQPGWRILSAACLGSATPAAGTISSCCH